MTEGILELIMRKYYSILFSFLSRSLVTPKACKGGSNILLAFLCVGGLLFAFSIANAIEVEGHLTEDTTWSPNNNPYHVIDDVFVDEDVTLTILPGTEVKFNSTILADIEDFENFIYYNGSNIAKMLWVDGKIIAEGTEEEPITFTRAQDSLYYHWGVIYITEFADRSIFKYCNIEYAARMLIVLGIIPIGAISTYNDEVIIENCNFIDNFCGVHMNFFPQKASINNNHFYNIENIHSNVVGSAAGGISISGGNTAEPDMVLVAGNRFNESDIDYSYLSVHRMSTYAAYNRFNGAGIYMNMDSDAASYFYKNNFIDCTDGIRGGDPVDSIYIKKNNFIGGYDGISINHAYVEISDNYFEGCDLVTNFNTSGLIFNNTINSGSAYGPGIVHFFNNISYNNENGIGICATYQRLSCTNNISINNHYAFEASASFDNCIFLYNEELEQFGVTGTPIFRNCILDFDIEPPCIDGGGNIWVDSLQAQTLFEDIQNGDFHLIEGSLAIDAGFDTLGYYYPFDMDYNHRVWDGNNNGSAIIDIGPYEYNSPAFGGIEGYTYNPTTGDPVDYVLLKIDNQPGEFTFSDSIGNFEYKLPAGIYDVYAERVFYEDVIEYQVEVFDEQFTQVLIPMLETVDVENIQYSIFNFQLRNYPNPFNPSGAGRSPETTISFNISRKDAKDAEIMIYNIKGQKIKTLECGESLSITADGVGYSISWNGTDENNQPVSSGIYFYQLKISEKMKATKKCLLLK